MNERILNKYTIKADIVIINIGFAIDISDFLQAKPDKVKIRIIVTVNNERVKTFDLCFIKISMISGIIKKKTDNERTFPTA